MWADVGDRTELQHIDPNSYGHNRVSFPFSWAAQPEAWGPSLSGICSHSIFSNSSDFLSSPSYIIVPRLPSSCGRHKSHSFNPSTVKVIFWYFSTWCTCYLHRCISFFDSLAGVWLSKKVERTKSDLLSTLKWEKNKRIHTFAEVSSWCNG